jgi:hypothetical protein
MDARSLLILLAWAVWPAQFAQAQFVDLTAEVEVNDWNRQSISTWATEIHFIIGPDSWQMDGDFSRNARVTYRFTGTNLIEESIITKALPAELVKRFNQPGMPFATAPAIGSKSRRVVESMDGNPGQTVRQADHLTMVARIGWLAFCSGPCLKREGRSIFPPNDLWKELVSASRFNDRTLVFGDALGLPKSMDLSTTNGQQVMQYRVVGSTNVSGWELPLEFYLAQYRPAAVPDLKWMTTGTNGWELDFVARGHVKVVTERTEPQSSDITSDLAVPSAK